MGFLFENTYSDVIALTAILIGLGYYYVSWTYSYWQRKGVQFLKPSFPLGNLSDIFFQRTSMAEHLGALYQQSTEPYVGIFNFMQPSLLIRDPELMRTIMIKDFNSFQDRGTHSDESYDPLSGQLFSLGGEKWKILRAKLSPTFTSGKLKAMFSTIVDCSGPLEQFIGKQEDAGRSIELRELLAQYSTNIIASVAFGIDVDCIGHPDVSFRKIGRQVFQPSVKNGLRFLILFLFPKIMSLLKIKGFDQEVEDFMVSVVRQNMEYREKNNVSRKDFFQLLLQLRNTGDVQVDGLWDSKITNDESLKKLSINECAAQAFIFFLAGFETASTTMSFAMYEMAKNQDIQQKVQLEIDEVLKRHDDQITYESISEMKYLESVVSETLRKYPGPMINRQCNTRWTIPNTDIVIEPGTPIVIPLYGVHHDPKYFPEPEKFIPERFSAENKKSFIDKPYLPFGEGPRNCIGMRMGLMEAKIGLVTLLQRFSYTLTGSSLKPIRMTPQSIALAADGGINLNITKRQK